MKKNGFTLIELIATIGLLGMLATILITVSVKKINETKEHSKKTMIESIELAAKQYVTDYKDELSDFQNNDYIYVTLQTLVEKNYFSNSLIDPTTNKSLPLTDTVYVTRESNGEINATYDINQKEKAKIVLNGSYNEYIKEGTTFTDLGVNAVSSDGTNISSSITTTSTVDTTTPGTYKIKYEYGDISIERNVIVYEGNIPSEAAVPVYVTYNANEGTFGTTKYDYTGSEQIFTVPVNGYYKIEVWGAQGGNLSSLSGGYGGYVRGSIMLNKKDYLYLYIGENYNGYKNEISFNGGGKGSYGTSEANNYNGGGATDVRYFGNYQPNENDLNWNSNFGLNSRIIVAGGGGGYTSWINQYNYGNGAGGNGGGIIGYSGNRGGSIVNSTGGTQVSGGNGTNNISTTPMVGVFGIGGYGSSYTGSWIYNAGGGGGYYGGGAGGSISGSVGSGAGGSSYISGHTGCVAIESSSSTTARTGTNGTECETGTSDNICSIHYSGMKFTDTVMIDESGYAWTNTKGSLQQMPNPSGGYYDSGVGHIGNGAAIINQITYEKKSSYLSTYPINDIPVPTREGYNFIGWFTDPVGGTQVTSSTIINTQNAHELYAHWEIAS